jgi:branched-chain amino acid transport system ATP-binding protein
VIRGVNAAGMTILLVEHNMRVVMNLCHEILVVHHGARLAEGTPERVARDPQVVAAYLGGAHGHA